MLSVPSRGSTTSVTAVDSNGSSSDDFFFKDGRRISVGDCALFKPLQGSPPFIGIVRFLTSDKEGNLRLCVNWLHRPVEVKLGKGVVLEAAPNEVFYSFLRDEISAASLLHPCKVAFLPKGVELPPGVSSFVCRRVYDNTNKCLWWLTDQDRSNDMQKEIDQLLRKTRTEMHATLQQQQGARSPKPVNGSATASPLKHSPDSMQHSSSNLSSQTKGKKRERGDNSSEPIKRERSVRAYDGDSGQFRSENTLKQEIAKITERGLVDSAAVERLVQLMQSDRKIDLAGRSVLAGIIASTDRLDCLSQFVQLRGLPVLDAWLQDFHKGKIGDFGDLKDGDKSVEDFLLVLLRALDKLPVNLNALQMCNIGKSVNHLRSHKNSEIQKKARSLVDTWKKRVEAEISSNDAKSGSSREHDGSHGGNRHTNATSQAVIRSPVTHHSSLRSSSVKLLPGDSTAKSASACPGGARSALPTMPTANYTVGQFRISVNGGSSEYPQAVAREEKSSSSSPCHTDSQSSDHAENIVPSGKEDARSSTDRYSSSNKIIGSGSKSCKLANGLPGTATSGVSRETVTAGSSSMATISVVEKVSHPINSIDASIPEGSNHKLIVKIPNRIRGPVQGVLGGAVEDSSCINSRASSPAPSGKHDQSDACLRGKPDSHQADEIDGSSTAVNHRTSNDTRRIPSVSEAAYSSPRNETKSGQAFDSSFSSMNALIESCVKFSEASVSLSAEDDVGMNLLASVAASEMSKSGVVSPVASPRRNPTAADNSCNNCDGNKKHLHGDDVSQEQSQSTNAADVDKNNIVTGVSEVHDGECCKQSGISSEDLHRNGEGHLKSNGKLDENFGVSVPVPSVSHGCADINGKSEAVKDDSHNQLPVASQGQRSSLEGEDEVNDDVQSSISRGLQGDVISERSSLAVATLSESVNPNEKPVAVFSGKDQSLAAENLNEVKCEKTDDADLCDNAGHRESNQLDRENDPSPVPQKSEESGSPSADRDQDSSKDENVETKEALGNQFGSSGMHVSSSAVAPRETELHQESKITDPKGEKNEDSVSDTVNTAPSPAARGSDIDAGLRFDLNEGFNVDDGKNCELDCSGSGPRSATICLVSPSQIPFPSTSSVLPASVTVAAAAKGPFVPPDDLLRNKNELGWKGSAATSAFRPAEPRKLMEVPSAGIKVPLPDAPSYKQARPQLDFDLNVPDERTLLDFGCQSSGQESNLKTSPVNDLMSTASLRCSGGLDLDLNKADEAPDVGQHSSSSSHRLEFSTLPVKISTSAIFPNVSTRDFDLNNGPATDDTHFEQAAIPYNQHARTNYALQPTFVPRINNSDTGSCFSWCPPGTSYSVSVTPSALPDREAFPIVGIGGGPQRVMGGPTPSLSFNPDVYRGSVLSSTPGMPFPSAPFQYTVFPLGTNFALPTSTSLIGSAGYMDAGAGGRISSVPSQLVGSAAAGSVQYPHPYVSRPILDVGNNGVTESNRKWGKQGLDLNSGPGGLDMEGREESLPAVPRLSVTGSQSLAEEQSKMYNMAGGVLKRNEPEGGWSMDLLNFKQSSWR